MSGSWPWLVLAGLGAYHGLNPAMGWLFAAALGLHRRSRAVVLWSLVPIALGHALAVAIVVGMVVTAGIVIQPTQLRVMAGAALLGWAAYRLLYGSRHRVRVGMQTGAAGLVLWSFLMAGAHGAGLMALPALIPLCLSAGPARGIAAPGPPLVPFAAVGLHTAAMLAVTGVIAIAVYEWIGVSFLRRGWINLDLVWTVALFATGFLLLVL